MASEVATGICASYMAGSNALPGITGEDFCKEYGTVCGFTKPMRYDDAFCAKMYNELDIDGKACRAGYLCNARAGSPGINCSIATGLSICD
jgi:hypothetical protein